jgi:Protein of unknown function (DUF3106)
MALVVSAALFVPYLAQAAHANGAQNHQDNRPPRQQSRPPQRQSQGPKQQRQEHTQQQQGAQRGRNERQNSGTNRPPNANTGRPPASDINRAGMMTGSSNSPNRPPSAYTPPPRRFNQLSPQEQKKVVESYNKQKNLTPVQRQEINRRIENWNKLTPEQKSHVRSDLAPKWNQMPKARQDAIQHRLEVLQSMPESARNQHLNDPNFTRGMSEEDKATLRDLSHMHMGAPDPPNE